MNIIRLQSLSEPDVQVYSSLTEAQLRNRLDPDKGIFIAESPKVIKVALQAGYEPISLLCEEKHINGDAKEIIDACPDTPVFTGSREMLAQLTGYTLTRGVLCAMRRKSTADFRDLCRDARRIAVIDGVTDTTNIGAIFRSAAALGIDCVLLTPHRATRSTGVPCACRWARYSLCRGRGLTRRSQLSKRWDSRQSP